MFSKTSVILALMVHSEVIFFGLMCHPKHFLECEFYSITHLLLFSVEFVRVASVNAVMTVSGVRFRNTPSVYLTV